MKTLSKTETQLTSGGDIDLLLVQEVDPDRPFASGYKNGVDTVYYTVGMGIGLVTSPVVIAYHAVSSIVGTGFAGAQYAASFVLG